MSLWIRTETGNKQGCFDTILLFHKNQIKNQYIIKIAIFEIFKHFLFILDMEFETQPYEEGQHLQTAVHQVSRYNSHNYLTLNRPLLY